MARAAAVVLAVEEVFEERHVQTLAQKLAAAAAVVVAAAAPVAMVTAAVVTEVAVAVGVAVGVVVQQRSHSSSDAVVPGQVGVRPVQLLQGHEALVVHGRRVL
jgi:hypothetical protein